MVVKPKLIASTTIDSSEDGEVMQIETIFCFARSRTGRERSRTFRLLVIVAVAVAIVAVVGVIAGILVSTGVTGSSTSASIANKVAPTKSPTDGLVFAQPDGPQATESLAARDTPSPVIAEPTASPTGPPTKAPSSAPSAQPSSAPTIKYPFPVPPLDSLTGVTRFYGIADIPYTDSQHDTLREQIDSVPSDAEFIVHLGDIRSADHDPNCKLEDYTSVAETLRRSPVPIFIIPGDNEWNDCDEPDEAWKMWESVFMFFEDNWAHNFTVKRMPGRNDTFAFINKGSLFIGLNIVGGRVHDHDEWDTRLTAEAEWVIELIRYYDSITDVGRVILFGHADPTGNHDEFYHPVKHFLHTDLGDRIPVLVLNGDLHVWKYEPSFFSPASSMLRVMLTGEGKRPMHKITITATNTIANISAAFSTEY